MRPQTIFVIIASIVFLLAAYWIPKKMKPYEIYATSLFAALFGLLVDTVLAVKYKLYVLDKVGIQIPALIGQVIFYVTSSILLLNLYPYGRPISWRAGYVFCFTLVTLMFEYLSYKVGFIKYNEWKIGYSVLCYPFLIYFLICHYRFFQWLVKQNRSSP